MHFLFIAYEFYIYTSFTNKKYLLLNTILCSVSTTCGFRLSRVLEKFSYPQNECLKINERNDFMTNLERLKLELNNKEYFTDTEYITLLNENNLIETDTYDKGNNQRDLLWTVVDILEAVANNVDLMRKVETEFTTTSQAVKYINDRIERIKNRIQTIPDAEEEYSNFSLMFTRN